MKTILCSLFTFLIISALTSGVFAESIAISGTVIDDDSVVVAGAMVALSNAKLTTTTNDSGRFVINNISNQLHRNLLALPHFTPSLKNGSLEFSVDFAKDLVIIDIYTLSGIRAIRVFQKQLATGVYSINIFNGISNKYTNGMYVVRLSVGEKHYVFKSLNMTATRQAIALANKKQSVTILNKIAASVLVDTLVISKAGYYSVTLPISSYTLDLQKICMSSYPMLPITKNIGTASFILQPYDSLLSGTNLTFIETLDSVDLPFGNDSLIGTPLKLTTAIAKTDTLGFLVRIPLSANGAFDGKNMNIYLAVTIDSVTTPLFGTVINDTLWTVLHTLDTNMIFQPIFNSAIEVIADTVAQQSLQKRATANWSQIPWAVICDIEDVAKNAPDDNGHSLFGNDLNKTRAHIRTYVINNAKSISQKYKMIYGLKAPALPFLYWGEHQKGNSWYWGGLSSPDILKGLTNNKNFPIIIKKSKHSGYRHDLSTPEANALFIGYTRLKDVIRIDRSHLGSINSSIAHEMLHSILYSYDIYHKGIHEGLATTMGHSIDWNDNSIHVRDHQPNSAIIESEQFKIDYRLFNDDDDAHGGHRYANHDFFAYIGRLFSETIPLLYITDFAKAIAGTQWILDYNKINNYITSKGRGTLPELYLNFICNRAYEHFPASVLRVGDEPTQYKLDYNFCNTKVGSIITGENNLGNFDGYTSQAFTIDLSQQPAGTYSIKTSTTSGSRPAVVLYPENPIGTYSTGTKIIGNALTLNTAETPFATMLVVNNNNTVANDVKIYLNKSISDSVNLIVDIVNSDNVKVTSIKSRLNGEPLVTGPFIIQIKNPGDNKSVLTHMYYDNNWDEPIKVLPGNYLVCLTGEFSDSQLVTVPPVETKTIQFILKKKDFDFTKYLNASGGAKFEGTFGLNKNSPGYFELLNPTQSSSVRYGSANIHSSLQLFDTLPVQVTWSYSTSYTLSGTYFHQENEFMASNNNVNSVSFSILAHCSNGGKIDTLCNSLPLPPINDGAWWYIQGSCGPHLPFIIQICWENSCYSLFPENSDKPIAYYDISIRGSSIKNKKCSLILIWSDFEDFSCEGNLPQQKSNPIDEKFSISFSTVPIKL